MFFVVVRQVDGISIIVGTMIFNIGVGLGF